MGDSFEGTGRVEIQPGDVKIPVTLRLSPATASTNNDGSLPYGSTVVSVVASFHSAGGTATTHFAAVTTVTSNRITSQLTYSSNMTAGLYHGTWKVTASISGSTVRMVREFDLNRIYVKNV